MERVWRILTEQACAGKGDVARPRAFIDYLTAALHDAYVGEGPLARA